MCSLVTYSGSGFFARHALFRLDRSRAGVPEAGEAPLGRMVYLRWDRTSRRKLLEIDCVVPQRPDVRAALQAGFEAAVEQIIRAHQAANELAFRGGRPAEPVANFSSDWIICWWYTGDDSLVCNGVSCVPAAAEIRGGVIQEMSLASVYECANGCAVAPAEGMFYCSGGGGGWVQEGDSPDEAGGGGTGGGYCPNTDPECLLPLRWHETAKIRDALGVVDGSQPVCSEAATKIRSMLTLGMLFRGNPDIPDNPSQCHDAQARVGTLGYDSFIHVDQGFLTSSSLHQLAGVLLHEAWHVLGYPDHEGEERPPYGAYPYSQQQTCLVAH